MINIWTAFVTTFLKVGILLLFMQDLTLKVNNLKPWATMVCAHILQWWTVIKFSTWLVTTCQALLHPLWDGKGAKEWLTPTKDTIQVIPQWWSTMVLFRMGTMISMVSLWQCAPLARAGTRLRVANVVNTLCTFTFTKGRQSVFNLGNKFRWYRHSLVTIV